MDLDKLTLSRIAADGLLSEALEAGISSQLFVGEGEQAWAWALAYYQQHGTTPGRDAFEAQWPGFLTNPSEPLSYYADELQKRFVYNAAMEAMHEATSALKSDQDPRAAIDLFAAFVRRANEVGVLTQDVNWAATGADRIAYYEELRASGGIDGVPWPWPTMNELTQGAHDEDLIFVVAREGTGKCVAAGTQVVDPVTGIPWKIEDYVRNPEISRVTSWDRRQGLKQAPLEAKLYTGVKECLRFVLRSGREVIVTPEHPFLCGDGWRRADDIEKGETIAVPAFMPEPEKPSRLLDAEVELLAVLLAEGSYTGNHYGFSNQDPEIVRIATEAGRELGAWVERRGEYDYDFVRTIPDGGPNPIRLLLERFGMAGKLAKRKTIPDEVFRLPNDQLARFLSVFWMCDGYVDRGVPGIILASQVMVEQIQSLLLRFAVQSSVHYKSIAGGKFHAWRLAVYSTGWGNFAESFKLWGEKAARLRTASANPNVGGSVIVRGRKYYRSCQGKDPDRKWYWTSGLMWDPVMEISPVGPKPVYDLTVAGTHCFVANGILVHNTWWEGVAAHYNWTKGYKPIWFSQEMAVWQITRRLDAMHSRLPYQQLRSGRLDAIDEVRWREDVKNLRDTPSHPFIVVGGAGGGVSQIAAKVDQHEPDIVYIDGGYLVRDERKGQSRHERVTHVAEDLKLLGQSRKVPVVVTYQFNRQASRTHGEAEHIALADIAKTADDIVGLFQSEDQRLARRMLQRMLKQREGNKGEWESAWDLSLMDFHEIGDSEPSSAGIDDSDGFNF